MGSRLCNIYRRRNKTHDELPKTNFQTIKARTQNEQNINLHRHHSNSHVHHSRNLCLPLVLRSRRRAPLYRFLPEYGRLFYNQVLLLLSIDEYIIAYFFDSDIGGSEGDAKLLYIF